MRADEKNALSCYDLAIYKYMISSESESVAPRSSHANFPNVSPHLHDSFLYSDRDDTFSLQLIPRLSKNKRDDSVETSSYGAPRSPSGCLHRSV